MDRLYFKSMTITALSGSDLDLLSDTIPFSASHRNSVWHGSVRQTRCASLIALHFKYLSLGVNGAGESLTTLLVTPLIKHREIQINSPNPEEDARLGFLSLFFPQHSLPSANNCILLMGFESHKE